MLVKDISRNSELFEGASRSNKEIETFLETYERLLNASKEPLEDIELTPDTTENTSSESDSAPKPSAPQDNQPPR